MHTPQICEAETMKCVGILKMKEYKLIKNTLFLFDALKW